MAESKNWYAIYTRPRTERKVHGLLTDRGYESYCPLNKVLKQWSDRIKTVEEPLFTSYVFVKLGALDRMQVRFVPGVINLVYWLGKPATIRDSEISRIRRFMNQYSEVQLAPLRIEVQSRVIINAGILMDREGIVVGDRKQYVEVEVESLGCKLIALVPRKEVKLVPNQTINS